MSGWTGTPRHRRTTRCLPVSWLRFRKGRGISRPSATSSAVPASPWCSPPTPHSGCRRLWRRSSPRLRRRTARQHACPCSRKPRPSRPGRMQRSASTTNSNKLVSRPITVVRPWTASTQPCLMRPARAGPTAGPSWCPNPSPSHPGSAATRMDAPISAGGTPCAIAWNRSGCSSTGSCATSQSYPPRTSCVS